MKKLLVVTIALSLCFMNSYSQGVQGLLNKVKSSVPGGTGKFGLSSDDIVSGLKEALRVGTDSSVSKVSKVDGFFGNAAIKILMPPEAQKAEKTLRSMGMGSLEDKEIFARNREA